MWEMTVTENNLDTTNYKVSHMPQRGSEDTEIMSAHLMSVMSQVVKYDNDLHQTLISEWLLDTGADVHVMTLVEWRRLGEPMLTEPRSS